MEQNLDHLKKQIGSTKKEVYKRLIDHCESYFPVVLPEEHPASSTTFMGMAMANLSLAYILTDHKRYLDEAQRWILVCVGYPHWGNAHLVDVDLSAAWILFGLGITYDWLKESLPTNVREAVKEKLILQGDRMYNFKIETEGSGWSTNYWQNHNWINMTGLASAGYALIKEDGYTQKWIDSAKENFDYVYSVMPEDGSDYEGVVYWRYGAMWLYIYAHLLKEREGINYFKSCDFLKNSFYYRLYQAAPNLEEQIYFGDAHDKRSGHSTAIYYKTAAEYGNGHAQKLGNLVRDEFLEREASLSKVKPGIMPEAFFEVLFYSDEVEEKEFDDLPLTKYFDDLGLFVQRSSWKRDASHFSFKCSQPGGKKQWDLLWKLKNEKNYNCFGLSHQHPDNNSFIYNCGGEFFAIDDGYNRTVKASDHNVVLVDGVGFEDEGQNNIWKNYTPEMKGDIVATQFEEGFSYIAGESAPVYQKDLKMNRCRRHVFNTGKPYFVMIDELDSDLAHTYTWQMYSDIFPDLVEDLYRYEINGKQMDLFCVSSSELVCETKENTVRAVMTTQEPDKYTENHMKGICFSPKGKVKTHFFISALVPAAGMTENLNVSKIQTEGAWGLVFSNGQNKEIFMYSPEGLYRFKDRNIEAKISIISLENNEVTGVRVI